MSSIPSDFRIELKDVNHIKFGKATIFIATLEHFEVVDLVKVRLWCAGRRFSVTFDALCRTADKTQELVQILLKHTKATEGKPKDLSGYCTVPNNPFLPNIDPLEIDPEVDFDVDGSVEEMLTADENSKLPKMQAASEKGMATQSPELQALFAKIKPIMFKK
jgi:hypothetical protein